MKTLFAALILAAFVGCAGRGTFNTIAATDKATTLSFDGYVDSVIHGETKTNDLPVISKSFDMFKASERVAIDAAQGNVNGPVTGDMATKAALLIQQINNSKGKK